MKNLQKNKGFVMLFAVTLSALVLSIALGITNVAFKEVKFSTSAKDTDDAFFAADTGMECGLYYDKVSPGPNRFVSPDPGGSITCAGNTISPAFSGNATVWSYNFNIISLGNSGQGCAKVIVAKDNSTGTLATTFTSKGYNDGGPSCTQGSNSVERQLQVVE